MEDAENPQRRTILPGVRGVLIVALVYLVIQVLLRILVCWIVLFGFGQEPDHLGATFDTDMQIVAMQLGWPDYLVMAFDVLVSFALLAAWVYVLLLFVGRKRKFLFWFLTVVMLGAVSGLLSFVLLNVLFGSAEFSGTSGGGAGVILALGIYQMLVKSPRTKTVFVN